MSRAQIPLMTIEVRNEHDVVQARQRARQIAAFAAFDLLGQTRLGTAVSEIARNAVEYAGGGQVRFQLADTPLVLAVEVEDHGPGLGHLDEVLGGTYVSRTGMGIGLSGTRRLMDEFRCETGAGGTVVRFAKRLPQPQDLLALARRIGDGLAAIPLATPLEEVRSQNQELLRALQDLRDREQELTQLNHELEATNRGVVALYAELDQRADHLRQASDIKSRFLSNMTHEFRTPLNSIIALTRMLLAREDGPLTGEQVRQVEFIRTGASGLSEMVDDLLDLAKVESGKLEVAVADFALGDMLDSLRGMLKPLLANNHSVTLAIEQPPAVRMRTDEGKLAQIVRNFISNALKFTERGEVRLSSQVDGGFLSMAVSDTGIGISEADQQLLFNDFSQVQGAIQRRTKGTGLGLSLSRRLAELLGGTVGVSSTVGLGSTFTVRVPVVFALPDTPPDPLPDPVRPSGFTILHVEDDAAFRYVLRSAIGSRCALIEAGDGEAGLRVARTARPDALVIDLDLPRLDGFALYAALRADPATRLLPVVVLSSSVGAAHDQRLDGCVAVIDKSRTDDPGSVVLDALRATGLPIPA